MSEISETGLARHVQEDVYLDKPKKINIRGKLVYAVKTHKGELIEVSSGDKIGLKCGYPYTIGGGEYLRDYKVR